MTRAGPSSVKLYHSTSAAPAGPLPSAPFSWYLVPGLTGPRSIAWSSVSFGTSNGNRPAPVPRARP